MNSLAKSVLDFWFTDQELSPETAQSRMSVWFAKNADFDYDIERRFGKLVSLAANGGFYNWQEDPKSALALIILLDQFPRNLFRNTPRAFATDAKALAITKFGLARGDMSELSPVEAIFFLMPFQHTEDLDDQNVGLTHYQRLAEAVPEEWKGMVIGVLDFARRHQAVIQQFGRFPHRNDALGRTATEEEKAYLSSGGDRF